MKTGSRKPQVAYGHFDEASREYVITNPLTPRPWDYYRKVAPPVLSDAAGPDLYLNEPYMYSSHIVAEPDYRFGMANLSWLTGTVNWMYIVVTQHILGIRPTLAGLRIEPCIPSAWKGFFVTRRFRGATYEIEVVNRPKGKPQMWLNDAPVEGCVLPVLAAGDTGRVKVHAVAGSVRF